MVTPIKIHLLYDRNDSKKKIAARHSALPTTPATCVEHNAWNVKFHGLLKDKSCPYLNIYNPINISRQTVNNSLLQCVLDVQQNLAHKQVVENTVD